jgi:hypothetical protein
MVARHGKTPIAWMKELGVLGGSTILGHAIIIGGSSWTNYPAGDVGSRAAGFEGSRDREEASPDHAPPTSVLLGDELVEVIGLPEFPRSCRFGSSILGSATGS